MLCGDDHGAVSSTNAHQTEFDLAAVGIPVLHPASVREYLDFGLLGFALSRFAGLWVGFKCLTQTVESSATVSLPDAAASFALPDVAMPRDGVHIRLRDPYLDAERRLMEVKLPAARAFVRANGLDHTAFGAARPRLGLVTVGKSYGDVRQALAMLGLDAARCRAIGLGVYKIAMPWPLDSEGLCAFAAGTAELLVVEEKRALIEPQIKDALFHMPADQRPRVVGKTDEAGAALLSAVGELDASQIAAVIAARLAPFHSDDALQQRLDALGARPAPPKIPASVRTPYYCSGCPHNSSTRVPEGSRAGGGIGCHAIALGMPDRNTPTLTQMGGEGAP
ncbi:MAG: indolepyruvate ferredoxin oxidoreductase family protein, partial [Alphaproteobacteria bacterium]